MSQVTPQLEHADPRVPENARIHDEVERTMRMQRQCPVRGDYSFKKVCENGVVTFSYSVISGADEAQ